MAAIAAAVDRADPAPDPFAAVAAAFDGARLRRALADLPPEQRWAVEMAFFGGLTPGEIAARTRLPLGTVKGRLRLGLRRLRADRADRADRAVRAPHARPAATAARQTETAAGAWRQ